MNKKARPLIAGALFSLLATFSAWGWSEYREGEETHKVYKIRGMGDTRCSAYLAEAKKKDKGDLPLYTAWMEGYLTSRSVFLPDTAIVDSKETGILMWWIERYCELRPEDKFSQAAWAMIYELAPEREPHRHAPGM